MAAERFSNPYSPDAVIFDAGSSGTRPFIYRITRKVVDGDGKVLEPAHIVEVVNHNGKSFDTSPDTTGGLQDQKTDAAVAAHLGPLFTAVETVLARIIPALPAQYYLYATGGVRDRLTPEERGALHTRVTNYIERTRGIPKSQYTYKPIPGTEEAKYGWAAANRSQGRPYSAGYVEMGGATAQIAFPVKAEDYEAAARVVENVNLPTEEEMRKLFGNAPWAIPEVTALRQGHEPTLVRVLSLWAGDRRGNAEEIQRWAGDEGNPGDLAKLEGVVRLWGGDPAKVEEMINGIARLEEVRNRVEMGNRAKLMEEVGPKRQKVFLASYPLGSVAGYKEYLEALFTGDTYRGEVVGGRTIFHDPSKRDGYSEAAPGYPDRILRSRNAENLHYSESNLAKTFHLVGQAQAKLFPGAAITKPLDSTLRKLDFIGASNFWWTMCVALNAEGAFNLSTFHNYTKDSSKLTHAELQQMHPNAEAHMRRIYDNSVFTATWTLCVLRQAFGLPLMKTWDGEGRDISFTPYNGDGLDKNRFSWTLGTAVLLASPGLDDLEQCPVRAPAA
ncbi:hypothetical protein M413DRAFT_423899 [Hebeloma cylindrosporum]|uniref:guanosine-diphosphatase n=1 Tax=Hebeloma cylindrosporum TaxID=76867 RepID=A0A0C2XGP9_HEBCY|nr:hypothetical protein M413DRAFT_423899 [Hebeloma cylindrosporum h7]